LRRRAYDWSNFLDIADALLASVGGEGAERTAISRAYYGSYGMACAHARSKNLVLARKGSDHATIWNWFEAQPTAAHVRIAQAGRRLKRWRTQADYDDRFQEVSTKAVLAVETARRLLRDLEGLS
jgi:hypothetical protein